MKLKKQISHHDSEVANIIREKELLAKVRLLTMFKKYKFVYYDFE